MGKTMQAGSCHCGAIRITLTTAPEWVIDCNCSICRRNGAQWALVEAHQLGIAGHPHGTEAYVWGARSIATLRCRHCGCITHWDPAAGNPDRRVGVNLRNFNPDDVARLRVRRFDGTERWHYLD
jgi:hypothetical protein